VTYSLRIHTFPHPTRTDNAVLRVAVLRGAINGASPPLTGPLTGLISSVSEHDLENAALGYALPLLRSLGPSPEDRLRALAPKGSDGTTGLCVHAAPVSDPDPSLGGPKGLGCCRASRNAKPLAAPVGPSSVCLGADKVRCRLGHKEMPECWEAPESSDPPKGGIGGHDGHGRGPDPIEIIRLWREGVYVTTVRG
jgi:hypothetical protein